MDSLIAENRGLEAAIINGEKFATDAERVLELGKLRAELDSWKERIRMTEFLEQENDILRNAEEATQKLILESQTQVQNLRSVIADKDTEIAILNSDLQSQQKRLSEEQTRNKALQIEIESLLRDNNTCNSSQVEDFRARIREFDEEKEKLLEENAFGRREVTRLQLEAQELRNRMTALESLLVQERELRIREVSSEKQAVEGLKSRLEKTGIKPGNNQQESTRVTLPREDYEHLYKQALDFSSRQAAGERFSDVGFGSANPSTIRHLVDLCASGYRGQTANVTAPQPNPRLPKDSVNESVSSEASTKGFLENKKEKIRRLKEVTKRLEEGSG